MRLDVGIGEWKVSNNPDDEIKTYALGSCVGVWAYDTINRAGGLIHIALPYSEINQKKAGLLPGYFADTGLPLFFNDLKEMGAERLYMWITSAASISGSATCMLFVTSLRRTGSG